MTVKPPHVLKIKKAPPAARMHQGGVGATHSLRTAIRALKVGEAFQIQETDRPASYAAVAAANDFLYPAVFRVYRAKDMRLHVQRER